MTGDLPRSESATPASSQRKWCQQRKWCRISFLGSDTEWHASIAPAMRVFERSGPRRPRVVQNRAGAHKTQRPRRPATKWCKRVTRNIMSPSRPARLRRPMEASGQFVPKASRTASEASGVALGPRGLSHAGDLECPRGAHATRSPPDCIPRRPDVAHAEK
jgi:hypothetical protein